MGNVVVTGFFKKIILEFVWNSNRQGDYWKGS